MEPHQKLTFPLEVDINMGCSLPSMVEFDSGKHTFEKFNSLLHQISSNKIESLYPFLWQCIKDQPLLNVIVRYEFTDGNTLGINQFDTKNQNKVSQISKIKVGLNYKKSREIFDRLSQGFTKEEADLLDPGKPTDIGNLKKVIFSTYMENKAENAKQRKKIEEMSDEMKEITDKHSKEMKEMSAKIKVLEEKEEKRKEKIKKIISDLCDL